MLIAPAGVVHGLVFTPETEGYVVTLADTLLRDLAHDESAFTRLFQAPASSTAAATRLMTLLVSAVRALHEPADLTSAATSARAALVARFREAHH